MKNLTNNQILSTSEFIIPSSTGEYLPTNISTIYEADDDLRESNYELFEYLQDNGIQIIYSLNIKESHQAYNELLDQLQELLQGDYIGDDDFFDYIPDLINQMQHIALYYNHNFPEKLIPIQDLQNIIKDFDNRNEEQDEQLIDQCSFDLNKLFEEQELIQKVLKYYPNDQQ